MRHPQGNEEEREELAALEAHDADVLNEDSRTSASTNTHAADTSNPSIPPPSSPHTASREHPDAHSSSKDAPNFSPAGLAPSTTAQWMPSASLEATSPSAFEKKSSSPSESAPASAPDVQSSDDPEKTLSFPAELPKNAALEKMPATNEKTSPASSEVEKEVDLESGKQRSSSSSKVEVTTEQHSVRDPDVVDWEGPDDPQNPMNWPSRLKWGNVGVISSITFLT